MRQLGTDEQTRSSTLTHLQDQDTTKIIIMTLPEITRVREATALQDELQRAGISPWAWIMNQSLNGLDPASGLLRMRAGGEVLHLHHVRDDLATRSAMVPLQRIEPRGVSGLARLSERKLTRI